MNDNETTPGTSEGTAEPWQWSEAHWRGIVDHVRAGRTLKPAAWKGGARCAVAFSFDSDHETNELRDGGLSFSKLSQGQYGNRRGVPRILDVLARHDVPATFYVPAVTTLLHPDEQRRVVAEGHEIGIHGWIHERNSVLRWRPSVTCRCARPTRSRRSPAGARSASARRHGTSAPTHSRSRATWASNTTHR
jgi:hypothetical protein